MNTRAGIRYGRVNSKYANKRTVCPNKKNHLNYGHLNRGTERY